MNFRRLTILIPLVLVCMNTASAYAGGFRNSSSSNYGDSYAEPKKESEDGQICEQKTQMFKGPWGNSKNSLFVLCSDGHMWVIDMNSPDKGWEQVPDVKSAPKEAADETGDD